MGCDEGSYEEGNQRGVSIHAPAWGATNVNNTNWAAYDVSIHAPAWGATTYH